MAAEQDVDQVVRTAFFATVTNGVIVEVGAARPDYLSISASYRALGWKVIAIEPNPQFCAAHRLLGYDVLEYAVSDVESDNTEFFVIDSLGSEYMGEKVSFESFSSLGIKGEYASLYETVKARTNVGAIPVKVRKLDTILAKHEPTLDVIDILAVDVEGWELNVVTGLSLDRYKPKIVILENLFNDADYVSFMQSRNFALWRRLWPNDIYVQTGLLKA